MTTKLKPQGLFLFLLWIVFNLKISLSENPVPKKILLEYGWLLFLIVICNYLAQIVYEIHLYHGHFNPVGALLLALTFIWFLAGFILSSREKKLGSWLLVSYLLAVFIFYFHNQIILSFFGYGIFYHFLHVKDSILWFVFFIGDINFLASGFFIYYFLRLSRLWKDKEQRR